MEQLMNFGWVKKLDEFFGVQDKGAPDKLFGHQNKRTLDEF